MNLRQASANMNSQESIGKRSFCVCEFNAAHKHEALHLRICVRLGEGFDVRGGSNPNLPVNQVKFAVSMIAEFIVIVGEALVPV